MIETHYQPDQALSDGFQQLDLEEFAGLLEGLGLGLKEKVAR
jgi:3-deoxy-D-arabino-heptulosonate 7-phosphate (DAHP) synthase